MLNIHFFKKKFINYTFTLDKRMFFVYNCVIKRIFNILLKFNKGGKTMELITAIIQLATAIIQLFLALYLAKR